MCIENVLWHWLLSANSFRPSADSYVDHLNHLGTNFENSKKKYINIGIHVDDLLITSNDNTLLTTFKNFLLKKFYDVKFTDGTTHNYLGININLHDNYYELDMTSNLQKIRNDYGNIKISLIPASNEFFKEYNDKFFSLLEKAK